MVSGKKVVIAISVMGMAIAFSLGLLTRPAVLGADSETFSAVRVSRDIEVISREPHSLENPEARSRVRAYLASRLSEIGFDVEIKQYDSVKMRSGSYTSIFNIQASAAPLNGNAGTSLLMIAHYDSRHTFIAGGEAHLSYGAADDGYGLGVILETARLAMNYRDQWKQEFRIIFTDAEENRLDGIKMALENEPLFFKNAGLAINIEARGVKGPAILFETSAGNERLVELYSKSDYPYSYSLTSAIYRALPNDTDFSPVKESIPGFNFSVIDNLDYYHTRHDNYSNISLGSVQHYGSQIQPITREFLTDEKYSVPMYLKGESDLVYFTVPFTGIISFSKSGYTVLNILMLIISLFSVVSAFKNRRVAARGYFSALIASLIASVVIPLVAYLGTRAICLANDAPYRLIALAHLRFDEVFNILFISAIIPVIFFLGKAGLKRRLFSESELSASSVTIMSLFALVLFIATGENFFLLVPLLFSLISFSPGEDFLSRNMALAGVFITLLTVTPFIYSIQVALGSGALFITVFYMVLLALTIVPACYTFTRKVVK